MPRSREDLLDPVFGPQPRLRVCDQPGCAAEGQFRAPRSREELGPGKEYHWFCLEHVREYNAAWNYYRGMSDDEIEGELRRDTVWQRPTWPLGWRVGRRWRDPLDLFGDDPRAQRERAEPRHRQLTEEDRALAVFDLELPLEYETLRARYMLLVKRHHPDANGGSKEAEERLKIVTHAYAILKARFFART